MPSTTFLHSLPTGETFKRSSKTMSYTHVVLVSSCSPIYVDSKLAGYDAEPTWGVYRWSQSATGAESGRREVLKGMEKGYRRSEQEPGGWVDVRVEEINGGTVPASKAKATGGNARTAARKAAPAPAAPAPAAAKAEALLAEVDGERYSGTGAFTDATIEAAARMRGEGAGWKAIGEALNVKSTGLLSTKVRKVGA